MNNQATIITVGSDPEIFVENLEGRIVSGIDLIPGTKEKPFPISEAGHCIQVDNIAWEFNIPVCNTEDEFVENIKYVLSHLGEIAAENNLRLSTKASDEILPEELTHPIAKRFGCEPDFNAYTMSENESPNTDTNLRCVGGHFHIGYPNPDVMTSVRIVKMFDLLVTLEFATMDPDTRRRELYGKPGAFRFKDFGLECRALSNYWIHSEERMRWVYSNGVKAAQIAIDNIDLAESLISKYSEKAVDAITTNNQEMIAELVAQIKEELTVTV